MDSSNTWRELNLSDFRKKISDFINDRHWDSYHTPKSLAIAISLEAAELLEYFLFQPDSFIPPNIDAFSEEMADIFIYLMSLANNLNIPSFSDVILRKMEKNSIKYPIDQFSGKNYRKQ